MKILLNAFGLHLKDNPLQNICYMNFLVRFFSSNKENIELFEFTRYYVAIMGSVLWDLIDYFSVKLSELR